MRKSIRYLMAHGKTNTVTPVLAHSSGINMLFRCDNLECLRHLKEQGFENKLDLVYIDPPFQSGERYYYRNKNKTGVAFEDSWDSEAYLEMLRARLAEIRKLMSSSGAIFLHLDWHASHYVKVIMDQIFGPENFRNEIIVKRGRRKNLQYQFKAIDRMHNAYDSILWYSKTGKAKFVPPVVPHKSEAQWMGFWSNTDRPTMRYEIFGYSPERGQWKWSKARALKAIDNYKAYASKFSNKASLEDYWNQTGRSKEFIRKRERVKYAEYWIPPKNHRILDNVWLDVEAYDYSTGYGTEKHQQLLDRIITQFSKRSALVADFFCGSGTTLVVAEKLGRRWIGCDSSSKAISVTRKRLGTSSFSLINL